MRIFLESDVDRIELVTGRDADYIHGHKTTGFGVPLKISRLTRGAGVGASYRGTRTDTRVADLNVIIRSQERLEAERHFRRLAAIVIPRRGRALPRIIAEYDSGEVFELPFVYLSGLEIDSLVSGPRGTETLISIECPGAFWVARDALTFRVANDADIQGLLPNLAELPVMSSTAISSITVENPGDVEADIAWTITGPGGPVPVSIDGAGFTFETPLVLGEVITIQRTPLGVTVLDQDGVNRYADLAPAPKFPRLPEGTSTVNIAMENASRGIYVATTDVEATNLVVSPALRTSSTGWATYSADATQSRSSSSFGVSSSAGYLQLAWAADSNAEAAMEVEVPAAPGDLRAGSMSVISSIAQVMLPVCSFVDAEGEAIGPLFVGAGVEVPAETVVEVGFSANDVGEAPEGAVALRFMVTVDAIAGQTWSAGSWLRASLAIISPVASRVPYFDGDDDFAGWAGADNDSASSRFRKILVGQSSVAAFYKPLREVIY